ncbi:MAG: prepilin-type N-terminal cleavage/methylation domain-containing protein [Planctomycetota bacterium]
MRARKTAHNARAGFTLLEIVFAVAILGLVLGSLTGVLDSTRKGYGQGSAGARAHADARRAIDRIAAELENAGLGTLFPNPIGVAASDELFQTVAGVNPATSAIIFNTSTRLRFAYEQGEANNGLDDDGDGLVDEGQVILTRNVGQADEISTTLVRGISEYLEGETGNVGDENANGFNEEQGFCMTLQGSLMILRITLERPVPEGNPVLASVETAVRLKN